MPLVIKPKLKLATSVVKKKETIILKPRKIQKVKKDKKEAKEKTPREIAEQTRKWNMAIRVLDYLRVKYPDTFGFKPKPLAIGIKDELFDVKEELKLSKTELRIFLGIYTHSKEYKEARIVGASRYNLKGEVTGLVTKDEAGRVKK